MVIQVDGKYIRYCNQKADMVTTLPVEIFANPNMKSRNGKCKLLKYEHPRKYSIEFAGGFYTRNKNDPEKIEDIISHELAHIKYPYVHNAEFCKLAGKLGASKRYQKAR